MTKYETGDEPIHTGGPGRMPEYRSNVSTIGERGRCGRCLPKGSVSKSKK